jgi:hypothetical protein
VLQLSVHFPLLQPATPLAVAPHALPQAPQLATSESNFWQPPLQAP